MMDNLTSPILNSLLTRSPSTNNIPNQSKLRIKNFKKLINFATLNVCTLSDEKINPILDTMTENNINFFGLSETNLSATHGKIKF